MQKKINFVGRVLLCMLQLLLLAVMELSHAALSLTLAMLFSLPALSCRLSCRNACKSTPTSGQQQPVPAVASLLVKTAHFL